MKTITLSNKLHTIEMTKLAVGHSGISIPEKSEFVKQYMDAYIDAGGNCVDTARLYEFGNAELEVGEWLKGKSRDKIVLVTKCAHFDREVYPIQHRLASDEIRADIETSLHELDVDYIDVLFLHRDDINRDVSEIMPTLHEFVKTGKVRILGASNWTAGRIAAANKFANENGLTPFSVSQIHHSLGVTTAAQSGDLSHVIMDDIEYSWYSDEKFPVMAWSATAHGFFSKLTAGEELNPRVANRYSWSQENFRRSERAKSLAEELGVSVGAVVLAYLMCDENVPTTAIASFSKFEQFEEAIEATKVSLTQEQRKYLAG